MMKASTFFLLFMLSGCAMFQKSGDPLYAEQQMRLEQVVELIKKGNTTAAGKLLTTICREKPTAGVTDEALFRLALLQLRTDRELAATSLGRLLKEYPGSPWARTAPPVLDMVEQNEDLRNQNKALKGINQALTKENKELLQNIEKIKHLDLELEKKQNLR